MAELAHTSWVMYKMWDYERLKPFLCDSCPQARYEGCIVLFPGWENCSGHRALCTALTRQKNTITVDSVYSHIQKEGKKVSLSSDSVLRAKGSEDQRRFAFLKVTNTPCGHCFVFFH